MRKCHARHWFRPGLLLGDFFILVSKHKWCTHFIATQWPSLHVAFNSNSSKFKELNPCKDPPAYFRIFGRQVNFKN